MMLQQTIWGKYYIRIQERFCDSRVIDTTFDQAKIIIAKDVDNWNSKFWRLWCHKQVNNCFPHTISRIFLFYTGFYKMNKKVILRKHCIKFKKFVIWLCTYSIQEDLNPLQIWKNGQYSLGSLFIANKRWVMRIFMEIKVLRIQGKL